MNDIFESIKESKKDIPIELFDKVMKQITDWKSNFDLESGLKCTIDGYKRWLDRICKKDI